MGKRTKNMMIALMACLAMGAHAADYAWEYTSVDDCTAANIVQAEARLLDTCYKTDQTSQGGSLTYTKNTCSSGTITKQEYTDSTCSTTSGSAVVQSDKSTCATKDGAAATKEWSSCTQETLPTSSSGWLIDARLLTETTCTETSFAATALTSTQSKGPAVYFIKLDTCYQKDSSSTSFKKFVAGSIATQYSDCSSGCDTSGCSESSTIVGYDCADSDSSSTVATKYTKICSDSVSTVSTAFACSDAAPTNSTSGNAAPLSAMPSMALLGVAIIASILGTQLLNRPMDLNGHRRRIRIVSAVPTVSTCTKLYHALQ